VPSFAVILGSQMRDGVDGTDAVASGAHPNTHAKNPSHIERAIAVAWRNLHIVIP
jgi:hypothetical protein